MQTSRVLSSCLIIIFLLEAKRVFAGHGYCFLPTRAGEGAAFPFAVPSFGELSWLIPIGAIFPDALEQDLDRSLLETRQRCCGWLRNPLRHHLRSPGMV